ncbi:MAG: metallophosphoesterase, partial [Cytophagaceae bacterium]
MKTVFIVVIILLVFFGIDIYVFQAIKIVSSSLSLVTKRIIYSAYWLLSIFAFVGLMIYVSGEAYRYSPVVRTLFAGLVMTTYFTKLFIVLFLFIDDLQRLFRWGVQKATLIADDKPVSAGEPISRSGFLVKAGLIVSAIPFLSMTAGIVYGVHNYRIRRVKLALKNLPDSFVG